MRAFSFEASVEMGCCGGKEKKDKNMVTTANPVGMDSTDVRQPHTDSCTGFALRI